MMLHGKELVRTLKRVQKDFISEYGRTMDREYCVVWIAKKDMEVLLRLIDASIDMEIMDTAACREDENE